VEVRKMPVTHPRRKDAVIAARRIAKELLDHDGKVTTEALANTLRRTGYTPLNTQRTMEQDAREILGYESHRALPS
jgi:hypothetical protein